MLLYQLEPNTYWEVLKVTKAQATGITVLFVIAIGIVMCASSSVVSIDGSFRLIDILYIILGVWKLQDIVKWLYHKLYK